MILVTLGTQDKSFKRLLEAVEKNIINKKIKDKVVIQAGNTKFRSNFMEIIDFIEYDKFDELIKSCDLLITHGGVGSIITGLKYNKKVIAAARLEKYKEHQNDHQKEIIKSFKNAGYILELEDFAKLSDVIKDSKNFKPTKFISNNNKMLELIKKEIG